MRALLVTFVLAALVPDRPDPTPRENAKPLPEQIVGDWLQIQRVIGGIDQPNPDNRSLAFTRDVMQHVHLRNGMKEPGHKFAYSLDTTKNPAVIRFLDSGTEGIIKIEGDLLTICYGSQRPGVFVSPANSSITLVQATRIKR